MITLQASTSDTLRVITAAAVNTDISAHWEDRNGASTAMSYAYTPGSSRFTVSTATNTLVVDAPKQNYRVLLALTVRNRHSSTAQTVTVSMGTCELVTVTLAPGSSLMYTQYAGFFVLDSMGRILNRSDDTMTATVNALNTVVLAADVSNANAVANTMQNVTGLSFSVLAGRTYWFDFAIAYTAAAATTGSRWSVSGPTGALYYESRYPLTATTETINFGQTAYDLPATSNASSLTSGNIAHVTGMLAATANGTLIARFASEVAASAITAKAGSVLQWYTVI